MSPHEQPALQPTAPETRELCLLGEHVQVTTPAPPDLWAEIFSADPGSLPFHSPQWAACLTSASHWRDATRLYETSSGRRSVLLMAARADPSGRLTVQRSWPSGWGAGGVIAEGGVRARDVALVARDLQGGSAMSVSVRPAFPSIEAWGGAQIGAPGIRRVVHVLPIHGTIEQYTSRLPSRLRSDLRQAERRARRHGLSVSTGNSVELVRSFYEAYLTWLERKAAGRRTPLWLIRLRGRRQESFRRFCTVAEELGRDCQIWVATLDGRPVGASISLYSPNVAVGWRAFTDHNLHRGFRLMDSLIYRAIEDAYQRGCAFLEMGESGDKPSLVLAKARWGATAHEFHEYCFGAVPWHRLHAGFETAQRTLAR